MQARNVTPGITQSRRELDDGRSSEVNCLDDLAFQWRQDEKHPLDRQTIEKILDPARRNAILAALQQLEGDHPAAGPISAYLARLRRRRGNEARDVVLRRRPPQACREFPLGRVPAPLQIAHPARRPQETLAISNVVHQLAND